MAELPEMSVNATAINAHDQNLDVAERKNVQREVCESQRGLVDLAERGWSANRR